MNNPFTSEEPTIRFWAVVSSIILSVTLVLAGSAYLICERMVADYGTEVSRLFIFASKTGITGLALSWAVYMATLVLLLGYEKSDKRIIATMIVFAICLIYHAAVLLGSIHPFVTGTKSVM